ncbi:ABC transporter ATP-binding protein [Haploplasma modicum]|uniref:ABC transporter ATP-binding protein n=1 Tax=Haploplasma modicum TaxID=2150 RepID=UPI00214B4A8E|nr:ABC transporter ATP-binding protein [Haploplasma modicum]MCR1809424.1 ABC transporter ATP-binding protein [Haploplasma modicum]
MKAIEMINVKKDYITSSETINALKQTNFSVNKGELVAVIGPSGSGKSTFLTILGGLQKPTTGEVLIEGLEFSNLDLKDNSKIRFDKLGFILQQSNLIPFLTVKEQLILHNKIKKKKVDNNLIDDLLNNLSITKLKNKYPKELSGGERQRVAIAKALYHNPVVIFADEPTASLDSKKAIEVITLLRDITKSQNKATIIVTHDERLLEYCDKVYSIVDGKLDSIK